MRKLKKDATYRKGRSWTFFVRTYQPQTLPVPTSPTLHLPYTYLQQVRALITTLHIQIGKVVYKPVSKIQERSRVSRSEKEPRKWAQESKILWPLAVLRLPGRRENQIGGPSFVLACKIKSMQCMMKDMVCYENILKILQIPLFIWNM